MSRAVVRMVVIAIIAGFVGIALSAGAFALIPDPGSAPSIFDDFAWNSTANGFWHIDESGATATIKNSILTLKGNSIELDRRVQTDPNETVVALRVRATQFDKFGFGLGVYHAGTVGMEFDTDGVRCGRGSDLGYHVEVIKPFTTPPVGQWFYLAISVVNPYPPPTKVPNVDDTLLKHVTLRCSVWDDKGHLLGEEVATNPPPNAHYVAFDEAYLRTWDDRNNYQVDWFYAGPPRGDPLIGVLPPGSRV